MLLNFMGIGIYPVTGIDYLVGRLPGVGRTQLTLKNLHIAQQVATAGGSPLPPYFVTLAGLSDDRKIIIQKDGFEVIGLIYSSKKYGSFYPQTIGLGRKVDFMIYGLPSREEWPQISNFSSVLIGRKSLQRTWQA